MYSVFAIDDLPMHSARSTERQRRSILVVGHPRETVSGIDVPCPAEEEFLEPLRPGPQGANDAQ